MTEMDQATEAQLAAAAAILLVGSTNIAIELLTAPKWLNPNHMSRADFDKLVDVIRRVGFLQPVLVRPAGIGYEIIDGAHRIRAAAALGMKEVPCIVRNLTDAEARAVQIAMNRVRGELNLAEVAEAVNVLSAGGWSMEELGLTGFSEDELADLIKATNVTTEEVLAGAGGPPGEEPIEEEPSKPFTLELTFGAKKDLQRVKRVLQKAAGRGGALGDGLLRLIDGE